jgi:hypothetical protein
MVISEDFPATTTRDSGLRQREPRKAKQVTLNSQGFPFS